MNCEKEVYKEALARMMPDFDEVASRIESKYAAPENGRRSTRPHWLVPVLAASCVVLLGCLAVPPVRASITALFTNSAEYLSVPMEERPAFSNMPVRKVVPAAKSTESAATAGESTKDEANDLGESASIRIFCDAQADWAAEIKSVCVEEAVWDGRQLTLRYTVDADESILQEPDMDWDRFQSPEDALPLVNRPILCDDPSRLSIIEETSQYEPFAAEDAVHSAEQILVAEHEGSHIDITAVFSCPNPADKELALLLPLDVATSPEPSGADFQNRGFIDVRFRVEDLQQPEMRTAEPGIWQVADSTLEITNAEQRPTGIYIDFECPPGSFGAMSGELPRIDFIISADDQLLTPVMDGARISYLDYLMTDDGSPISGSVVVPFAGSDFQTLTLIVIDKSTGEEYQDDPIELHFS